MSGQPPGDLPSGSASTTASGASLARLEGRIALGAVLTRLPELRLAVAGVGYRVRSGFTLGQNPICVSCNHNPEIGRYAGAGRSAGPESCISSAAAGIS
jgi:hypothetical protein